MSEERFIRLLLVGPVSFGPGKAELLARIEELGSLQAACAAMGMSYMKGWKMISGLNARYREPLVKLQRGGKDQGGAVLTERGREVLALYQQAERAAAEATEPFRRRLQALQPPPEIPSEMPPE